MRIYRYSQLKAAGVPYTYKHLRTLEKRLRFPRHFNIGENSVGWVADEVDAWVEARVRGRDWNLTNTTGEEDPPGKRLSGDDLARLVEKEAARREVTVRDLIRRIVDETHRDVATPAIASPELPVTTRNELMIGVPRRRPWPGEKPR